jgi:hypothetical protein
MSPDLKSAATPLMSLVSYKKPESNSYSPNKLKGGAY